MYALDNSSGVSVMPEIKSQVFSADEPRWFTEGGNGVSPSYPGADWFNIIQAELLNVVEESGLTPKKSSLNQLTLAVQAMIDKKANSLVSAGDFSQLLDFFGWCKLPNGLIIQWGNGTGGSTEEGNTLMFPIAFPTQCLAILATDIGAGAFSYGISPISTTQFKVWGREVVRGELSGGGFRWVAIGR